MSCPDCDAPTVLVPVPEHLREHAPDDTPAVTLCDSCLSVAPAGAAASSTAAPADAPDLTAVSDAFPRDHDAAVALALLVGALDSLVTNRERIAALVDALERAGVDPFLALDRLSTDPALSPAVDLAGRRHQLEQFL